jgi:hypothetical protein
LDNDLCSALIRMQKLLSYLGWFGFVFLILAIVRRMVEKPTIYMLPDRFGTRYSQHGWDKGILPSFGKQFALEGFEGQETPSPVGIQEETIGNPAQASLNTPLAPYSLLKDKLPLKNTKGNLTAESCYKADYRARKEPVGNYIQMTNNFRHETPDSCSAPLTEMVDSFYSNAI